MKKLNPAAVTVGVSLLVLAGCTADGVDDSAAVAEDTALSETVDVAVLEANRTPYVGDNSRVAALVDATGPEAVGEASVRLHTEEAPYGLDVVFSSVVPGVTAEDAADLMTDRAALLLATIDNVEEVRWELPDGSGPGGLLSRAQADALVGSPVADLGTSAEDLDELVRRLEGA